MVRYRDRGLLALLLSPKTNIFMLLKENWVTDAQNWIKVVHRGDTSSGARGRISNQGVLVGEVSRKRCLNIRSMLIKRRE